MGAGRWTPRVAWEKGDLSYKLRPYQFGFYDAIWDAILDPKIDVFPILAARQIGKSYVERMIGCEIAIRAPGAFVNIFGPVGAEMKKVNHACFRQILRDCPRSMRPLPKTKDGSYHWFNESIIYTAGVNNGHEDDQRGNNAVVNFGDEAGYIDNLEYCMLDIYGPQTDQTQGTTILTSTAPKTPAHEFCAIYTAAEVEGRAFKMTLDDTDYSPAQKAKIARRHGGRKSTSFRREYLCEFVVDEDLHIIQEWKPRYIGFPDREDPRYTLWDRYEAMDMGVSDLTATLFGHYNFEQATLYVEREWSMNGPNMTTDHIATWVRIIERELWDPQWQAPRGWKDPELDDEERLLLLPEDWAEDDWDPGVLERVADDNNRQLLNDLRAIHGLPFAPTTKTDLIKMVNETRLWVQQGRIVVSPECPMLLACLKSGIWKDGGDGAQKTRFVGREFARVAKLGHFDHLAALIYMVRNIQVHRNPIPDTYRKEGMFESPRRRIQRARAEHSQDDLAQHFGRARRPRRTGRRTRR